MDRITKEFCVYDGCKAQLAGPAAAEGSETQKTLAEYRP
jgi:hypothetical protein